MHRRGRRGTEGRRGSGEGGLAALRSAMEIPCAYQTRLNVSLEKTRKDDFSLVFSSSSASLCDFRTIRCEDTAPPRSRRVRSLTFACYYAAI